MTSRQIPSSEFKKTLVASIIIVIVANLGVGVPVQAIASRYVRALPSTVQRPLMTLLTRVAVPLAILFYFKLAQDVSSVAVAAPFVSYAHGNIARAKGRSKADDDLIDKGLGQLAVAKQTIVRVSVFMMAASVITGGMVLSGVSKVKEEMSGVLSGAASNFLK